MYGHYPPDGPQSGIFSPVDQHHSLLPPNPNGGLFANVPTSATHLAEQMESGGAKIEETLSRLNCRYHTLFFCASWGVVCASMFGFTQSLLRFELANLVNTTFLMCFGLVMSVLDIPGNPRWAYRYRGLVRKYLKLLTRLTGKSLCYLYLGCIISVSLWPYNQSARGKAMVFTAVTISCLVVLAGVLGLLIAFRKSLRLERLRKILQVAYKGNSPEVYRKYAITDPSHGMQLEEFNRLSGDHTNGKLQFEYGDLGIVYNALDEHQKGAINEREFSEWMAGPMTYL